MAAEDIAILVGISKYSYKGSFAPLDGPPNDIRIVREWLLLPEGGALDGKNIHILQSPATIPDDLDPEDLEPRKSDFERLFKVLTLDPETGDFIRRPGRLYLYFAGHGFSERFDDAPKAGVFGANALRAWAENICGTCYAMRAKEKAMFREIVLIMDCCRDAEINIPFDTPAINRAAVDAQAQVKLVCLYAAPKGGRAQERIIAERNNEAHGLITHAFLKALKEAPPDQGTLISSTALKSWLIENWKSICGEIPAPIPDFYTPPGVDLYFHSSYEGITQSFQLSKPVNSALCVEIVDARKKLIATCKLSPPPGPTSVCMEGGVEQALEFDGTRFKLRLAPDFYEYRVTGDWQAAKLFAVRLEQEEDVRIEN